AGLRTAAYNALLSEGGPSHKDEGLDRRQNAEDVLLEVLLMSGCGALLSTYSNVSVAAIYFAEPGFRFFMFGDSPPCLPESRTSSCLQGRCAGCGSEQPPLRCSRCRGAFFCSRDCQRLAWPSHRLYCQPATV
ncbi:unnamed protein product, partial [Polarella glacialis]